MNEPLEELYFNWLCAKVVQPNQNIYLDLLRILHTTEFVWLVAGDGNRAEDGLDLRSDFLRQSHLAYGNEWDHVGCSIFEMLLAFSNIASFETGTESKEWFWIFLTNLGLGEFRQTSKKDNVFINDVLYRFVWRLYEPSGHGGLFPMRWPKHDQRTVEIWYQFCEYVDEQGLI